MKSERDRRGGLTIFGSISTAFFFYQPFFFFLFSFLLRLGETEMERKRVDCRTIRIVLILICRIGFVAHQSVCVVGVFPARDGTSVTNFVRKHRSKLSRRHYGGSLLLSLLSARFSGSLVPMPVGGAGDVLSFPPGFSKGSLVLPFRKANASWNPNAFGPHPCSQQCFAWRSSFHRSGPLYPTRRLCQNKRGDKSQPYHALACFSLK